MLLAEQEVNHQTNRQPDEEPDIQVSSGRLAIRTTRKAMEIQAMVLAAAAIAAGHFWAAVLLALVTLPGMWRGAMRVRVARLLFPDRAAWLDHHRAAYFWLTLPTTWIWLYVFVASALTRRIEWRGNVYELVGPAEIWVVR